MRFNGLACVVASVSAIAVVWALVLVMPRASSNDGVDGGDDDRVPPSSKSRLAERGGRQAPPERMRSQAIDLPTRRTVREFDSSAGLPEISVDPPNREPVNLEREGADEPEMVLQGLLKNIDRAASEECRVDANGTTPGCLADVARLEDILWQLDLDIEPPRDIPPPGESSLAEPTAGEPADPPPPAEPGPAMPPVSVPATDPRRTVPD